MLYNFLFFVLVFFVYSFIGYVIEIISVSRIEKKIVFSRGYLIGPYLPIFGIGALLMIGLLGKYSNDLFALFVLCLFTCCLLEYFTSLILEKIFKLRWWDYSNKRFNINGRVCLENGIMFGLGGIILVRYFHPFLLRFMMSLPVMVVCILGSFLFLVMLADFIFSTFTICKLKIDSSAYTNRDSTSVVKKQVLESLQRYSIFHKRLFKAFPNIVENSRIQKIREYIESQRKKRSH